MRAARARGDECGPLAWRHEIAHPIGPAPGRRTPEQLIADALLTYQRNQPDGTTSFHYRFIELDRATMPVDDLAAKLARYATSTTTPSRPPARATGPDRCGPTATRSSPASCSSSPAATDPRSSAAAATRSRSAAPTRSSPTRPP